MQRARPASGLAGRYWVFGDAKAGDKQLMWQEFVELKDDRSVTLDLRNAMPVEYATAISALPPTTPSGGSAKQGPP